MKRLVALTAPVAAVLLFGFTISAPAQIRSGEGRVTIPESSKAKPGDGGVRAHTNVQVFTPKAGKPLCLPRRSPVDAKRGEFRSRLMLENPIQLVWRKFSRTRILDGGC